jgi:hypothetical protein
VLVGIAQIASSFLSAKTSERLSLQGRPKEDPSLAEAGDPEMADILGVLEVRLGLAAVAPADP